LGGLARAVVCVCVCVAWCGCVWVGVSEGGQGVGNNIIHNKKQHKQHNYSSNTNNFQSS
jgi:hypothetical protein